MTKTKKSSNANPMAFVQSMGSRPSRHGNDKSILTINIDRSLTYGLKVKSVLFKGAPQTIEMSLTEAIEKEIVSLHYNRVKDSQAVILKFYRSGVTLSLANTQSKDAP